MGDSVSIRGEAYDKAKYILKVIQSIYRTTVQFSFRSCVFAHNPKPLSTLTQPWKYLFSKSKLCLLDFQLLLSIHFCSVSCCFSCTCRAPPSGPRGLIFYTHAPTPINPLGHMIHHLFRPCHVPVFCVVAPTDVNPLLRKGSQLPFSLKARWL